MFRLAAVLSGCCVAAHLCVATAAPPAVSANNNRVPAGQLSSGVLNLHLEAREGLWSPDVPADAKSAGSSAIRVYALAEEGQPAQVPGPLIRVPQGTELHVWVRNPLGAPLLVHGLHQHPGKADDVVELAPGQSKELRFAAGDPGSYLYWASTAAGEADDRNGLMGGAFVVDPAGSKIEDRIFVIQLWAKDLFHQSFKASLAINGKAWPYTERVQATVGQPEHWRVINATPIAHPMHLHGFYFTVDAVGDGESDHRYSEAEKRAAVTETVLPFSSFDLTWNPERAGNWLFHCHILDHMSGYLSPMLYGPEGPAAMTHVHAESADESGMGMAKLVVGIHVTDRGPRVVAAKATSAGAERHLFVRDHAASSYLPAGSGFFLEGVSREVEGVGPPLVVTRGVRTAITVTNQTKQPTVIHWHGIEIESYYDGVAGWTGSSSRVTPPIAPGSSFVAYMTPPRAGTFIYHTHWHDVRQLTGGMYGALVVLPPGESYDPTRDKVFVLGRSGPDESRDPLVVNGNPQPPQMVLLTGRSYRFRFVNMTPNDALVGVSLHAEEHLARWRAVAKDGADLPAQQATVRDAAVPISVGETYDFEFSPDKPGEYTLRFCSNEFGREVSQLILVVPKQSPISVFAAEARSSAKPGPEGAAQAHTELAHQH